MASIQMCWTAWVVEGLHPEAKMPLRTACMKQLQTSTFVSQAEKPLLVVVVMTAELGFRPDELQKNCV